MSLEFFNGFLKYHYGFIVMVCIIRLNRAYLVHFVEQKLNSCGDFILSIIQILGWTPHLQTGIILVKVFGLHLPLWEFLCGCVSYTKRYQLLQLNLTMLTLHYQKWDTIMSYVIVSPDMHKSTPPL
jgi:hypothetical protein